MDDEQILRARQVAVAASAWLHEPADFEAYRRFAIATAAWATYRQPALIDQPADDVAAHIRYAARQALSMMDDAAVLLATTVAEAAAAWLRPGADSASYERLITAVAAWDDYCTPQLNELPAEELLDQLGEGTTAPVPLADAVSEVTAHLRTPPPAIS
ncbi:hypothetical protein [Nocardioides sp. PD653]|uniref:hypothetical protein n=1 Tax=Nocardioides sp. PD653 TaxID=393303 RepID=UPI000A271988|nr:hypothetical protein [Nocardioides sp. PD653]